MSRNATQPKTVKAVVPLCTVTLVVKDASLSVIVPPTRPGPCLGSEDISPGMGAAQGATPSTSGLWFAGASEKWVESFEGGPGKHVRKPEGASAVRA